MPSLTASSAPPADVPATRLQERGSRSPALVDPPRFPHGAEPISPDVGRKYLILVPQHSYLTLEPVLLDGVRCLIGSATDCHVRIPARGVAEHHALILAGRHRVVLTAWDQRTWLNDFPVRESALRAGDRLAFGPVELLVRQATPAEVTRYLSTQRGDAAESSRGATSEARRTTVPVAAVRRPRTSPTPARSVSPTAQPTRSTEPDAGSRAADLCDALQRAIADGILPAATAELLRTPPAVLPVRPPLPASPPPLPPAARRDAPHTPRWDAIPTAPPVPSAARRPATQRPTEVDTQRHQQREHELTARAEELQRREQEVTRNRAKLETRDQEWTRTRAEVEAALSTKQAELRCQVEDVGRERIRLTNHAAELDQRLVELDGREKQIAGQMASLAEAAQALEQRAAALENSQAAVDKAVQDLMVRADAVQQQERLVAQARAALDERSGQLDERDRAHAARQRTLDTQAAQWQRDVQSQLASLTAERQRVSEAAARLDCERPVVDARAMELAQRARQVQEQGDDLARREADLAARRLAADSELQGLRQELDEQRTSVAKQAQDLSARVAEFDRRAADLEQLAAQLAGREEALQSSLEMLGQRLAEVREQRTSTEGERQLLGTQAQELAQREQQLADQQRYLDRREQELTDARGLWNAEVTRARQELASERSRLAGEGQALHDRQTALERRQSELDGREQRLREQEDVAAGSAQAIEVHRAELAGQAQQVDSEQSALARRAEQLAEREQHQQRLEREFQVRHEEWQVAIDTERHVVAARAAEVAKALQELESRKRAIEISEQELKEREVSLRCEVDAERRALNREREELDERRQATTNEQDQHDRLALQRQAEELIQRQQQCQEKDDALQKLERSLEAQRKQIDVDLESLRAEQTLVEQEWKQLKADRAPLDTEREQLRSEREQLEAQIARLQTERTQRAAEREAFENDVIARTEAVGEGQKLLAAAGAVNQTDQALAAEPDACDVSLPAGEIASTDDPESEASRFTPPTTSPGADGWLLDEFLGLNPVGTAGADENEAGQNPSDLALGQGDVATTASETQPSDSSGAESQEPNLHSYVQDLLERLRSGRASETGMELAAPDSAVATDDPRESASAPESSTSEVEDDILASIDDIQQSVKETLAPQAKSRPDSVVEIRAGIGSLRELANYSARSALAQHTWKKTKSELGMKVSFVIGAVVTAAGMDHFLANSPKLAKLSILPLGLALLVAGDLAVSYFRARRLFAKSSAAAEAWQPDDPPTNTEEAATAPIADDAPATAASSVQYKFEYENDSEAVGRGS